MACAVSVLSYVHPSEMLTFFYVNPLRTDLRQRRLVEMFGKDPEP